MKKQSSSLSTAQSLPLDPQLAYVNASQSDPDVQKINPHINRQQLQQHYGISIKTAERLFAKGEGPPAIKIGRRVLYPVAELEAWLKRHTVQR